jgi:hypothetical protein
MDTASVPGQPLQPQPQGMSTAAKFFLALLVIVGMFAAFATLFAFVIAGAIGFGIARSVHTDLVGVATVASDIAAFDLPAGYGDAWSISGFGFSAVGYDGTNGNSHIMLAQIPSWVRVDRADIERQAREAARGRSQTWDRDYRFEVVGEQQAVLRGQEVTITIGEGTNHEGDLYREIIAPFDGNEGQALLIIVEPAATWDQAKIDAFLDSIR